MTPIERPHVSAITAPRSGIAPLRIWIAVWICTALPGLAAAAQAATEQRPFRIEEATIADLHRAITAGTTTCSSIVQSYVQRARAYNGVCTRLVTKDGARIKASTGAVRAGAPLKFPTTTVAVASVLPDFGQYQGLPIEFGRMESTRSDVGVVQQFGMIAGTPDAGQVNALSTLNLRGERSVTCNASCDMHPSKGPLPKTCPAVCEQFRQQPDAIERATELDARYGSHPDLAAMPMYCVPFSFKDVFDTQDMRSTGGADAAYAMDAAPSDATLVA